MRIFVDIYKMDIQNIFNVKKSAGCKVVVSS